MHIKYISVSKREIVILETFYLLSVNAFILVMLKILSFGEGLSIKTLSLYKLLDSSKLEVLILDDNKLNVSDNGFNLV